MTVFAIMYHQDDSEDEIFEDSMDFSENPQADRAMVKSKVIIWVKSISRDTSDLLPRDPEQKRRGYLS